MQKNIEEIVSLLEFALNNALITLLHDGYDSKRLRHRIADILLEVLGKVQLLEDTEKDALLSRVLAVHSLIVKIEVAEK